MSKRRLPHIFFVLPLVVLTASKPLHAWGKEGHRITARIAAKHLSQKARQKVFDLLKDDSAAKPFLLGRSPNDVDAIADAMAAVAMFADAVKHTFAPETREWHFLDLAKGDTASEVSARCPGDDCVAVRITQLLDALKTGAALTTSSNTFHASAQLKFAINFFGDIHQPLHCATNADAGGNCLRTDPATFGNDQLHATWDTGLVKPLYKDDHGHDLTEFAVARTINARFGTQFTHTIQTKKSVEMALESHDVAFEKAYGPLITAGIVPVFPFVPGITPQCVAPPLPQKLKDMDPADLSEVYDDDTVKTAAQQLAKGGFRLADALNRTFQ
ncbi:MAG: S1/P1 nuclease [Acidobacteria bacterium]|nr:S1/P1 nuclease [Acidobacteriota bacterium]